MGMQGEHGTPLRAWRPWPFQRKMPFLSEMGDLLVARLLQLAMGSSTPPLQQTSSDTPPVLTTLEKSRLRLWAAAATAALNGNLSILYRAGRKAELADALLATLNTTVILQAPASSPLHSEVRHANWSWSSGTNCYLGAGANLSLDDGRPALAVPKRRRQAIKGRGKGVDRNREKRAGHHEAETHDLEACQQRCMHVQGCTAITTRFRWVAGLDCWLRGQVNLSQCERAGRFNTYVQV